MLAVAIIVLLAAVAWFMGAFSPTATESSLKQKFDAACLQWSSSNCAEANLGGNAGSICTAYRDMTKQSTYDCATNWETVASACGCVEPYGTERP
ncbi:MAG: hypothetical protein KAT37_01335 [Candidatus Aenigmarchaeota archaeon]|nr:hypothetical protein [Candidatus Aenigmarchaeota archaeon]